MNRIFLLRIMFWAGLPAFLAWDWSHSAQIDLRQERLLIAAGFRQQVSGGHGSMAKERLAASE